jgi:uncharacterized membrane protein YphA (DoxX/SURF4 family)
MQGSAVADSLTELSAPPAWRRVVLRFAVAYWLLWTSWFFFDEDQVIIALRSVTVDPAWQLVVRWVGELVFGLTGLHFEIDGSNDRTVDWIAQFCVACGALIATIAWTLIARAYAARRKPSPAAVAASDARLRRWLRVLLRYQLAFILLSFGVSKLFTAQFPQPDIARLSQRFADASPMGLVWTFMGASPAYVIFSGAAEVLGGVLLLFRRTTTLGAMVTAAVMVNVAMLNLCYDIPLKLVSTHLVVMCVCLMAPDVRRLADVLWFHRVAPPAPVDPPISRRRLRIARRILKYGLIALWTYRVIQAHAAWVLARQPPGWTDGRWQVTRFVRDGHEVAGDGHDATRWRVIRFAQYRGTISVRWRLMDDSYGDLYDVTLDEAHHRMHLVVREPGDHASTGPVDLAFTRGDALHFTLEGQVAGATLHVEVERPDVEHGLLVNRGFHWVNDAPFNR